MFIQAEFMRHGIGDNTCESAEKVKRRIVLSVFSCAFENERNDVKEREQITATRLLGRAVASCLDCSDYSASECPNTAVINRALGFITDGAGFKPQETTDEQL